MPGKSKATTNATIDAAYQCTRPFQQVLDGCQRSICQTATRANRHRRRNPRGVVPHVPCKVSIKHIVLSWFPFLAELTRFSSLFQRGLDPVQYFKKVSCYIQLVSKVKVILCSYFATHTIIEARYSCSLQISESLNFELLAKQITS